MYGKFFNLGEKTLKTIYKILSVTIGLFLALFSLAFLYFSAARIYYPLNFRDEIEFYAKEFDLDDALIFAMIKTESGFNPDAESDAGAKGLMQITDRTGEYIAEKLKIEEYDLFDANTNIYFGCFYMKYLCAKFKNTDTALAAYNAGEGNVGLWLIDERYSDDGERLKAVPFPETEAYIKKIKKTFRKYRKLYGNILDKRQNFE